jgi:hypothetical protein
MLACDVSNFCLEAFCVRITKNAFHILFYDRASLLRHFVFPRNIEIIGTIFESS